MRLGSWAYDGTQIELIAEEGPDTAQNRYPIQSILYFIRQVVYILTMLFICFLIKEYWMI